MATMKIDIVRTLDGSQTLYLGELDEHYHSTFGAVQESLHVFIDAGYNQCNSQEISILEIGFGSGLNCFLTLLACSDSVKFVKYFSLDKYPLDAEVWRNLNYGEGNLEDHLSMFSLLHESPWNCDVRITSQFILHKIHADLLSWNSENLPQFDVVYFDAFSPDKQPELWSRAVFEGIYQKMNENSILVTYCAKGNVRRILQSIGFKVERIPGPPGKREMIRAIKL
jgi:tRNA U34 5-methylaminomethyl-2-thiouridine-forming methyltransferase MnmC